MKKKCKHNWFLVEGSMKWLDWDSSESVKAGFVCEKCGERKYV